MDLKTLQKIGLTKGESAVYIALLKTGNCTSGTLSKESDVSRSKVYEVIDRLKKRGLATEVTKRGTKYFEATNPSRIIDYLESKRSDLDQSISESKKLVPQLKKLQNMHLDKQEAKVYVGISGGKTAYGEILEDLTIKDEYLAFGLGPDEINNQQVKRFIKTFHLNRAEKKIPTRVIMYPQTKVKMKEFSKLKYYKYRFTKVNFPTNIAIYGDNVLTLVWGNKPVAFLIKSKQVAKKYKCYFEEVWKQAKK